MSTEYVCTLSERDLQKAKDELHEDPKERESQVETFRKWIKQQTHLQSPTDSVYLLRYLRHAKFSQLRAREVLEKFLNNKRQCPEWLDNIDMCNPGVVKCLKTGHYLRSPNFDREGRRILIIRMGAYTPDPKVISFDKLMQMSLGIAFEALRDESWQVNGFVYLIDFKGFTMKHQAFWGLDGTMRSTKLYTSSVPGRFKEFHFINVNPVMESFLSIARSVMPKKLQDRFRIHSTWETVYKKIPMECLPIEYLPDEYKGENAGTLKQLTEFTVNYYTSPDVRKGLLEETDPKWGSSKADKPTDIPNESFRRLTVD